MNTMITLQNGNWWKTCNFIIFALFLSSCNIQKQVWFSDVQKNHQQNDDGISRIYIDKYGYLYPQNQYIPKDQFFDPQKNGSDLKELVTNGNLWDYFKNNSTEYNKLAVNYNVNSKQIDSAAFEIIQENIIVKYADEIKQKLAKSKDNTLVVLIHGFNVADGTENFDVLRKEINSYKKNDFIYLDVFWDGLDAGNNLPFLKTIWGKAQLNSNYVAIALRRVLANLDQSTKIRVVAHSMGTGVATGAVFNTYKKFKCPPVDIIKENIMNPTSISKDIRLGLIAPAIPGQNTFINFFERGQIQLTKETNNINRIVLGINTKDIAVTKGLNLSKIAGSTSLGGDKNEYDKTKKIFVKKLNYTPAETDQIFQKVNFNNDSDYKKKHGIKYYFMQESKKIEFLSAIFD